MPYEKHKVPRIFHDLLKLLLQDIIELLEKNNIKYFIEGGSLLGAVRHGDIIPHDDDIDLGFFDEDYRKIRKLLPELKEKKIEIIRKDGIKEIIHTGVLINEKMSKVYLPNLWGKRGDKTIGTPTIDLFNYEENNDKIQLTSVEYRERFKNCFYNTCEFYPLRKYKFGHLEVFGPNNPMPYLHRYYGADCLQTIKIESRENGNEQIKNYIDESYKIDC